MKPKDSKSNVMNDKKAEEELKSKLKYCVVKNNRNELREILWRTISIRRQLLKKDDNDSKEFWKFYFIEIDLVNFNVLF